MAHTVDSFVETLRADGVEAGREAAEQIRRDAQLQAERTVREAEAKARLIEENAERERQRILERTRTELELASRDIVGLLQDILNRVLNRLLSRAAVTELNDGNFLKELIREIATAYAQADAVGEEVMTFNVSESMEREIVDWAIASLRQEGEEGKLSFELHGALASAGFEYKLDGATIALTPDSVAEALSRIVTPQVRELIVSAREGQAV